MTPVFQQFEAACRDARPEVFLVLGSGLGILGQRVDAIASVGFADIPGLPASGVVGHRGRWTLGRWGGRVVLVSEGRVHYYEGHRWDVVCTPIRLAARLGVGIALLTNAAGGIREDLVPGSLMPLSNHLEWNRPHAWRERSVMSPYSPRLLEVVVNRGLVMGLQLKPGVYGAVTGPSYETPAEIRALRAAGADAVGMSTSREISAGVAAGLECAAVSLVTNRAAGLSSDRLTHDDVLATGKAAANTLADLIEGVLRDV